MKGKVTLIVSVVSTSSNSRFATRAWTCSAKIEVKSSLESSMTSAKMIGASAERDDRRSAIAKCLICSHALTLKLTREYFGVRKVKAKPVLSIIEPRCRSASVFKCHFAVLAETSQADKALKVAVSNKTASVRRTVMDSDRILFPPSFLVFCSAGAPTKMSVMPNVRANRPDTAR